MADLHSRLNRLEDDMRADFDTLELTDGSFVHFGRHALTDDYLDLAKGEEIEDERARLYADALDDGHHGSMLEALIRRCQERYREEQ